MLHLSASGRQRRRRSSGSAACEIFCLLLLLTSPSHKLESTSLFFSLSRSPSACKFARSTFTNLGVVGGKPHCTSFLTQTLPTEIRPRQVFCFWQRSKEKNRTAEKKFYRSRPPASAKDTPTDSFLPWEGPISFGAPARINKAMGAVWDSTMIQSKYISRNKSP